MKNITFQESFEIELDKLDDSLTKPSSMITEYWLNAGLTKFWKSRYSGYNVKGTSFEQTQKRIDDLRTLVTDLIFEGLDITTVTPSMYTVIIPDNYLLLLGDTAGIAPADREVNDCWEKDEDGNYIIRYSDTIEGTIDTIDRIKENSLSEHKLRFTKAKPIRLIAGDLIKLYTDGKYKVSKYYLSYLRKPNKIDIHTNPFGEYTEMPEHTIPEIIKLSVEMYLENQADPRYQTYANEVSNME